MAKIITYESYGGTVPYALLNRTYDNAARDLLCGKETIEFIMGFRENKFTDEDDMRKRADELFFFDEELGLRDCIKRTRFYGWAGKPGSSSGLFAVVCVNEYDEEKMRVTVETYDGSETLVPIPAYRPDPEIPGLYVRI